MLKDRVLKDARDYQIIFLTLFLALGVSMRDWSLRPEIVGTAVITAVLTQSLLSQLRTAIQTAIRAQAFCLPAHLFFPIFKPTAKKETLNQNASQEQPSLPTPSLPAPSLPAPFLAAFNWRSPLISALGLSLLLRTDHIATMAFAASMAIASKFIFTHNNKHFFNPANFGIIAALALTQDAWVSPGQWGEELWYGLIFLGAGGIVLKRVGRWDTTVMFLGGYTLMEAARNAYLGWTWDVLIHRMSSGSLLLFALFMVTDPRSIPNARPARLTWATAIALLTFILRNYFYLSTAVFWALFLLAPLTIALDNVWAAPRFAWKKRLMWTSQLPESKQLITSFLVLGTATLVSFLSFTAPAHAFCGFYVARADTNLYNKASQVAIARDGNHTVLTMANDYQGDVADFAMVVPVPTIIQQEQVSVAESVIMQRLDEFSAPRLVEYFDTDPCQVMHSFAGASRARLSAAPVMQELVIADQALGVTIEEQFSVGEYDILILSATESDGLETWLTQNNYRIPNGARDVLAPYIRQGMKFFVAKVNLEEQQTLDYQQLRPLQIEYDSAKFMLPIRLGMLNAEAEQDLVVYLLSPEGRAELTNYRTVNIPTDVELPLFIQDEFGQFYPEMFQRSYEAANRNVAFLEYAWNMQKCDPCAAPVLNRDELLKAGAFWLRAEGSQRDNPARNPARNPVRNNQRAAINSAFITRLHVRYSRDKFPEDLIFQSTSNQQTFQGRYVTNHPVDGSIDCATRLSEAREQPSNPNEEVPEPTPINSRSRVFTPPSRPAPPITEDTIEAAVERQQQYMTMLANRFERESQNLARLTGQDLQTIRQRISDEVPQPMPSLWLLKYPKR